MSNIEDYRVLPSDPNLREVPRETAAALDDSERKGAKGLHGGLGCFLWGVIFIGIALVARNEIAGLIGASILVALLAGAIKSNNVSMLKEEKAQRARKSAESANQAEQNRVQNEASSLTRSLNANLESSSKLAPELKVHLAEATAWLQTAETEYQSNAFSPFWDAVENAANHLSAFNDKTISLTRHAQNYYQQLEGKNHTFPSFPIRINTLPDVTHQVEEMRRIVRLGQTNFQFANIWEHRRTREVLIAGFRTLGEAVNNLGWTLENSIDALQQSISTDMAKVVEEQIRTRESVDRRFVEQNRMLDNIQHGRKPKLTDTPRKY